MKVIIKQIFIQKSIIIMYGLGLAWLLSGCSGLKHLGEGEKLYTGSRITIVSDEKPDEQQELRSELESVIRPAPNGSFLGMRPRLWFYNITGPSPRTGPGKFIRNLLGRPPVLWSQFNGNRTQRLMENRLFNLGYFDASVEFVPWEKTRKAGAEFRVQLPVAYTLGSTIVSIEESAIAQPIESLHQQSLLKPGHPYRLSNLRNERERIATALRNLGYFYFHPDFLLFRADTAVGNREVNLTLILKSNTPQFAIQPYRIRNISIDARSPFVSDTITTTQLAQAATLTNHAGFKPGTLKRTLFLQPGDRYNLRQHDLTIQHLMGLNVFRFVNLRFTRQEDAEPGWLDVNVILTPIDKRNLSLELSGVSKSNNFAGPGLTVAYNNRNLWGGAENLSINFDGSYELLMGRNTGGARTLEAGITTELTVPRIVSPFKMPVARPFIPKTRASLSFNYLSRTDAFSVRSYRTTFGYHWNRSVASQHRYNPLVFSVFSLGTISPNYQQFFSREVLLRRGLFEQFLFGSEYAWSFNSLLRKKTKHALYFNINTDLSGNLLYLFSYGFNLTNPMTTGEYGVFGQSFSQYVKTDFDLRYYLDLGSRQKLVSRLAAGVGAPWGNSNTLPYIKLFTIGGSNSLRAFQPRSVGPGSYHSPDTLSGSFDINRSGELKLEMNLEYRYDFNNVVKAAIFADAGNVWNLSEKENAPGGQFQTHTFVNQIALGTGVGLRFDFTFFILRLDLAFPLVIPSVDTPGYFQSIKPFERNWRRQNLLLNLAIGYPF